MTVCAGVPEGEVTASQEVPVVTPRGFCSGTGGCSEHVHVCLCEKMCERICVYVCVSICESVNV